MSPRRLFATALAIAAASLPAHAQVSRVFVSVDGNDANVCSNIATPCRTLGAGIAQVDANGEVIVIASGSYAGGTISKAVKVNVASGVVAFSGLPIVVNPGAGKVVLRGLTLKAATVGSGIGIDHQSGTLWVENVIVDGWDAGLRSQIGAQLLLVKGSVFRNNTSYGLHVVSGSSASLAIDQSFVESNYFGLALLGGTGRVSNTALTANWAAIQTDNTDVTFQRCEISSNDFGFYAYTGLVRVSGSTVTRNTQYGFWIFTATVESFGNNVIRGNATDTTSPLTTVALQ
jgi:hypothetical protein